MTDHRPERALRGGEHLDREVRRKIVDYEIHGSSDSPESANDRPPIVQLRVMADYCSSGIWATRAGEPFHSMIEHSDLDLPASLAARFAAWQETFDCDAYDEAAFDDEGRVLARELKRFIGPSVRVVYGIPDDEEEVSGAAG